MIFLTLPTAEAGGFLAQRNFLLLQVLRPTEAEEASPQALLPGCPR
ncbi:MAG: hypothetical protein VKL59_07390 [Nostocaceae cyanobacterium]|nr:hypothetical protein [Nostocaceae cyanobacterium]